VLERIVLLRSIVQGLPYRFLIRASIHVSIRPEINQGRNSQMNIPGISRTQHIWKKSFLKAVINTFPAGLVPEVMIRNPFRMFFDYYLILYSRIIFRKKIIFC